MWVTGVNSFKRYAAVNTKIRGLEREFLSDEDFQNLLHKRSVIEVASYLKRETHYRHILEGVNENDIHRSQLETLIRKDHAAQIGEIAHYFIDGYRKFFRYVFIKREIEELKTILRNIKAGKTGELNKESFVHIGCFDRLNLDSLLSSKSVGDFIKNLRGSIYYKFLQPLSESGDRGSLFMSEMSLDLAYFDIFYRNVNELSAQDRKIVDELQGNRVDLLNIQWIYRGIKFYDISREVLFNYTIPYGNIFTRKDVKELCYLKDIDDFQDRILNTRYKFLFDHERTKDIYMERRGLRYQYFNVRRLRSRHQMDISEAIAFDILLEYEIRDIVTVIEGIRYDMPPDEAKKYLIRTL